MIWKRSMISNITLPFIRNAVKTSALGPSFCIDRVSTEANYGYKMSSIHEKFWLLHTFFISLTSLQRNDREPIANSWALCMSYWKSLFLGINKYLLRVITKLSLCLLVSSSLASKLWSFHKYHWIIYHLLIKTVKKFIYLVQGQRVWRLQ